MVKILSSNNRNETPKQEVLSFRRNSRLLLCYLVLLLRCSLQFLLRCVKNRNMPSGGWHLAHRGSCKQCLRWCYFLCRHLPHNAVDPHNNPLGCDLYRHELDVDLVCNIGGVTVWCWHLYLCTLGAIWHAWGKSMCGDLANETPLGHGRNNLLLVRVLALCLPTCTAETV